MFSQKYSLSAILPDASSRWVAGVYVVLGLVLWPIPVFNILHVESAAIIAFVAFFASAHVAHAGFSRDEGVFAVIVRQWILLVIPWIMLTVSLLWAANCGYWVGVGFYFLFPCVSVVLTAALMRLVMALHPTSSLYWFYLVGLMVTVGGVIYDIGLHPQFYVYNHVFGGVLGPIYDEELAIRTGLYIFRLLTLIWAAFFLELARTLLDEGRSLRKWRVVVLGFLIILIYANSARLGINTTKEHLQKELGGHIVTEHVDIYFDPTSLTTQEQKRLAAYHAYRYDWLAAQLGIDGPAQRIQSFIYPDPNTKAKLTGARYTNVAPVWLETPQIHVLQSAVPSVLTHELAHSFSMVFGLPVINASLFVGLVEGFAEAIEPPDGGPEHHAQVWANAIAQSPLGEHPDVASRMKQSLSPFGFWTGRGSVSYTTTASFVQYLLDVYGMDAFTEAYPLGDFEQAYGQSASALADAWESYLSNQTYLSRAAGPVSAQRFARPSLFEQRCPHYVPRYRRKYRDAVHAWQNADTVGTLFALEEALETYPTYPAALDFWGWIQLQQRKPQEVIARFESLSIDVSQHALGFIYGDALVLAGQSDKAKTIFRTIRIGANASVARTARAWIREALVTRPEITSIRYVQGSTAEKANKIAQLRNQSPELQRIRAEYLLVANEYEAALAALRTMRTPSDTLTVGLQRLLRWHRQQMTVRAYEGLQRYEDASAVYVSSAQSARRLGHDDLANWFADQAIWMQWRAAHDHEEF